MHATCPTCETTYTVPDERIGARGRKVRCTRCGTEWRAMPTAVEPEPEPDTAPVAAPTPDVEPPAPRAAAVAVQPAETDDAFEPVVRRASAPFSEPDVDEAGPPPVKSFAEAAPAEARVTAAPAEPDAPATASPIAPLPGRVHIRTRRHGAGLGRRILTRTAGRVAPFVGPAVFLASCLVLVGVFVFRGTVVAVAPELAGLYAALGAPVNLRGLSFGRIQTLREVENGQPVLVVEGSISNVTKQMRDLPALRFALRGADTQELYAWSIDPKSTTIESGDTLRFRTRLAAPPDQATEVQVRFAERRSQQAGLP